MLYNFLSLLGMTAMASAMCGTAPPSANLTAIHAVYHAESLAMEAGLVNGTQPRQATENVVNTYTWIIQDDGAAATYQVSDAQISEQVRVAWYFACSPSPFMLRIVLIAPLTILP